MLIRLSTWGEEKQNALLFPGSKYIASGYICRGHITVEVWETPGGSLGL